MSNNLNSTSQFRPQLDALYRIGVISCVVGLLLFAGSFLGGAARNPDFWAKFYQSYLVAFMFWLGVTAGPVALLLLHNTVGGGWGFVLKRQLTAATGNLPLMALLTVPLVFGFHYLYPWAKPEMIEHNEVLQLQQKWMAVPMVIARLVFYFASFMLLARNVNKWTWGMNADNAESNTRKLNGIGPPGIILYVICVTFLAVDLMMTITPGWNTSIIGLLFVVGQGLSTFSLMCVLTAYLGAHKPPLVNVPRRYIRDIGNFMLAFTLLWSYMSYGQLVITFSGNQAEEAGWYQPRQMGGWQIVGILMVVAHFALPFLTLLSSAVKTNISSLAKLGLIIIFMRFVDLHYWVVPGSAQPFEQQVNFARLPLDFSMPLAIGGLWLAMWSVQMRDKPIVPELDPRLYGAWPLDEFHDHVPEGYEEVPEDALSEAEMAHHG